MRTQEHTKDEAAGSLLGLLGFGKARTIDQEADAVASQETGANKPTSLARQARSQLLDAISSFLQNNDLEITPSNLLAAHGAFSGSNPKLARKLSLLKLSDAGITQESLDAILTDDDPKADRSHIEEMMAKVEGGLNALSANARSAHAASSKYGLQLEQHSSELEQVKDADQILTNLAGLTKIMLEHTRSVQEEMLRSETEANSLRKSLARAKRDAEIDHLTGLPNRRAFEALLEAQYRQAQSEIEPLTVAFCDIDHFKQVNDTHGHDTGDRVIKAIAEALGKISNDNCHVARHGGEEFVMLFRDRSPAQALAQLEQVREQLANRKFVNRKTDKPIGQITFSGGISDVFSYADPRAALAAADAALYQAKAGGRNQIVLAKTDQ